MNVGLPAAPGCDEQLSQPIPHFPSLHKDLPEGLLPGRREEKVIASEGPVAVKLHDARDADRPPPLLM